MTTEVVSIPEFMNNWLMQYVLPIIPELEKQHHLTSHERRVLTIAFLITGDAHFNPDLFNLTPTSQNTGQRESILVVPHNFNLWAMSTGPGLLHTLKQRDLTQSEHLALLVVKAACPCHKTNTPREFCSNGEDCDLCGRKM